jgi:hypothetical protein
MAPIATCRCPSCGVVNALDQSICLRCLGPLPPNVSTLPAEPMTGETCSLYRAGATGALLLLSSAVLEYTASGIAFTTAWSNVASISHDADDDRLWLYQTPQQIKMPLGSGRTWFSDSTRTIPLRQFGYPANHDLSLNLGRYAPHLRRYLSGETDADG